MVKYQRFERFQRFSLGVVLSSLFILLASVISANAMAESDSDPEFLPANKAFVLTAKLVHMKELTQNTGNNNPVNLTNDSAKTSAHTSNASQLAQASQVSTSNAKNKSDFQDYKLVLNIKIAPGYLLYRDHLKITTLDKKLFSDNGPTFPASIVKEDEILGKHEVYKNEVTVISPISFYEKDAGIMIEYQGCSEQGFCYAPQIKKVFCTPFNPALGVDIVDANPTGLLVEENNIFEDAGILGGSGLPMIQGVTETKAQTKAVTQTHAVSQTQEATHEVKQEVTNEVTKSSSATSTANSEHTATTPTSSFDSESESDRIAGFFTQKSLPLTLLAFLSLGLLLAFTPCVLPMIPILANILVGQDAPKTRGRIFFLATLYVLSVSVCYAIAGLAAGMVGGHLQATLQQPQILMILGFLILIFAFNQFNFLEFHFPPVFAGILGKFEQNHKQGSAIGAITMGAVSAIMVSPCVTPALVGALTYIGQTGNALLGGLALFALAFGMGLPLLIMASIGSHLLPKAGSWMSYVKNVTGILLLVLAASIFYRAFPAETLAPTASASATSSATSTASALTPSAETSPLFVSIQSPTQLTQALHDARAANKHVILDVYADWCMSCRKMDKEVFENKLVLNSLKDVALLRLDLTRSTPDSQALQKQLDIIGPPMVLFFGPDGKEARSLRLAGSTKSNNFLERVNQFLRQE